jgi:hypothetical protein
MNNKTINDLAEVLTQNINVTTTTLLMYLQGLERRLLDIETTVQIQHDLFLNRNMEMEARLGVQIGQQIGQSQVNLIKAMTQSETKDGE